MSADAAYTKLVESVELTSIVLLSFEHHRHLEVHAPFNVSSHLEVSQQEPTGTMIAATAEFNLKAISSVTNVEEMVMAMMWQLTYSLEREETAEVDSDLRQKFIDRNVPLNVWPYIRETVTTMTAKMGLPPLVLPTLKIVR